MKNKIILRILLVSILSFLSNDVFAATNVYSQENDDSGVITLIPLNTGAVLGTPIGSFTPSSDIVVAPNKPISLTVTYKGDPGDTNADFFICISDVYEPAGPLTHITNCGFTHTISDIFETRTLSASSSYTYRAGTTYYVEMARDCFYGCGTYYLKSDVTLSSFYGRIDTVDPIPECCSSVLFLPGIKGSILQSGPDTLWPPTVLSNDIPQLALTNSGTSINDVHTNGILNTFHGTPIYAPFSSFMDSLVADQTITEWQPMAYDWRLPPEDLIANGIKTATGTKNIVEEIEKLADHSKNGKVSIVAHSMGGLMGKAIIKKLAEEGKDRIIDSFVMVGSPQLGTPQAIGGMLHGDQEGIIPLLIANPADMRAIAQNMPSAYNLLPSSRYFSEVPDPVITFDPEATFTEAWRNFWGSVINTYPAFSSFVMGTGVERIKPAQNILQIPEVLNPGLLARATDFHTSYDTYQFPSHIRVVQVAGWGISTIKAIEYRNNHGVPGYKVNFTIEGDKTVVYPSAVSSIADETYFFNLFNFNKLLNSNTQHRDLLNSNPIQNLVKSIVKNESIQMTDIISNAKPTTVNREDQLLVSTYSPVVLGAYDQFGNFTGIDPNQNLSLDMLSIKEDIPGSTFLYTTDSQHIFLPKEGTYTFIYKGIDSGPTTVTVENFQTNVATPINSYTDIPTTPNTTAKFTIQAVAPEDMTIALDTNSDGTPDEVVRSDGSIPSLTELITCIKGKLSTLVVKDKLKQNLIKQISALEKKIENKKEKNAKILANLEVKISKQEMKGKINTADASSITSLLDTLEAQAESIILDPLVLLDLKAKIQSLTIKNNIKNDMLKRVDTLTKKQVIVQTLHNLSNNITKKAGNGKITEGDAQALLDLLTQVESVI